MQKFNVFLLNISKYLPFYNPRQNIWGKVKNYSKIGQSKKNLVSLLRNLRQLLPKRKI